MATPLFHFDFTTQKPEDVQLEGGAMYPANNTCLRLTKAEPKKWGRAIYKKSVAFSNQTTFQTTIKFTVKPMANNATPADGLVFFMAPYGHKFPANPCDGNFGIFGEAPSVFAVEFDTITNPLWDPDYSPHLGIDFESRISKAYMKVTDPSYIGHQVTLTITYVGKVITATVKTESHPAGYTTKWASVPDYDLSTILSGNPVEVGLGASTGSHVAFHDVFYWDFYSPAPKPN